MPVRLVTVFLQKLFVLQERKKNQGSNLNMSVIKARPTECDRSQILTTDVCSDFSVHLVDNLNVGMLRFW